MQDTQEYYIARDGVTTSISGMEMRRLMNEGKIDEATLFWDEAARIWTVAVAHPWFRAASPAFEAGTSTADESSSHPETPADEKRRVALQEELKTLEHQITLRTETLRRLTDEQAERRASTEKLEAEEAEREKRSAALREEQAATEQRLAEQRAATTKLAAEAEERERRLAAAREEAEQLARRAEQARAEEVELRRGLADLRREIDSLAALKAEADQAEAAAAAAREEEERSTTRAAALTAETRLATERLRRLETELNELEERRLEAQALLGEQFLGAFAEFRRSLDEMQSLSRNFAETRDRDLAARGSALAALEEARALVTRRGEELERFLAELRERLAIERMGVATETEIAEQKRRAASAQEELKFVGNLVQEETEQLARRRQELDGVRQDIADLERKRTELSKGLACLDDDFAARHAELVKVKAETRAAEGELETMRRRAAIHAASLEELRRLRNNVLEESLSAEERRLVALAAANEADMRRNEAGAARMRLEEEAVERRCELETMRVETRGLDEERRRLSTLLREDENKLSSRRQDLSALETRSAELTAAVREATARQETLVAEEAVRRAALAAADNRLAALEEDAAERTRTIALLRQERQQLGEEVRALMQQKLRDEEKAAQIRTAAEAALAARRAELAAADEKLAAVARAAEEEARRFAETKTRVDMLLAERDDLAADAAENERRIRAALARLAVLEKETAAREAALADRRLSEAEAGARARKLADEATQLSGMLAERQAALQATEARLVALHQEVAASEQERLKGAVLRLDELRQLLKRRENEEKSRLERLAAEFRTEFLKLKEDWSHEARFEIANEDLRKLREEVEARRNEVERAERQLSAMRAGLARLREENSRNLQHKVRAFESERLGELKRRLGESQAEITELEGEWNRETRHAELVEKRWLELETRLDEAKS